MKENDIPELRKRFDVRWAALSKGMLVLQLKLPNKEELWNLLLSSFKCGFKCHYCGENLLIKDPIKPYRRSFSFDHKKSISIGGSSVDISNFAICCTQCNIVKSTINESTFRQIITNLPKPVLDKWFHEIWLGSIANKIDRLERETC